MSNDTLLTHRVLPKQQKQVRQDLSSIDAAVNGAGLGLGAQGKPVVALQRVLAQLGLYSGKATGQFDLATAEAVTKLQTASGQLPTGTLAAADAKTLRAHEKLVKDGFAGTPAKLGQAGRDIRAVEAKLKALGLNPGKVDGVFDADTLKAVKAFRRQAKEVPDRGESITKKVAQGASHRIAETERDLKTLGYRHIGKANGTFGKNTARAVRSFQKRHHLKVTGEADVRTRKALAKATEGKMYPHVSPRHFQNGYDVADPYQTTAQVKSLLNKRSTRFMAIKATQGTGYTNPRFKKWWSMAGKKLKPGRFDARIAYHYLEPGNGRAQANKFLRTVGVHGKLRPGTRLALDWEGSALGSTASLRDAAKRIHQVTGKWPLIYTSASQVGRAKAALPHAPIWDAHYPVDKSDYKNPFVQTSGSGVDHDLFTGNEIALRKWAGW